MSTEILVNNELILVNNENTQDIDEEENDGRSVKNKLIGENFYKYVNQIWLNDPANIIPTDYSSWGGFTKLYDSGLKKQINIIKSICKKNDQDITEEENIIKCIWTASNKLYNNWELNICDMSPLKDEFEVFNNIFSSFFDLEINDIINEKPYINCLAKYYSYSINNSIKNTLNFDKGSNLKNSNSVILDLSISGLSLPSREYYTDESFSEKIVFFRNHLKNIENILNKKNINLGENFIENVLEFELNISKFTMKKDQYRSYDKYYTNTTLTELYTKINDLNSLDSKEENYLENDREFKLSPNDITKIGILLEGIYENLNLKEILEKNFDKNYGDKLESDNSWIKNPIGKYQIAAYDGDGLRRCFKYMLNHSNFLKYKSYIYYNIIKSKYKFCSKELDEEFFDFYLKKLGGQQKQKTEEKRCINIVNDYVDEIMGKLFINKFFPQQHKDNMDLLVKNILDIMKESLKNNDWLTSETKFKALNKLKCFRSKIGFPDFWKDYSDLNITKYDSLYNISQKINTWNLKNDFYDKINSILDKNEWKMSPQTVNAYFMPTQNEIVFPAAILQPPFFHIEPTSIDFDISEETNMFPGLDIVTCVNYGGIGAVIAHEITHGFDDKGRKFDLQGNLKDWWIKEDEHLFIQKTKIMYNSVIKYNYFDEEKNKNYKMNPELTMGENLADIGGLTISMKALLKKLKERDLTEIEIKASLRVFFKSWTNIWKENVKKDKKIMLLSIDQHAPCEFRGNLVQHIDEFYYAFDINENDNMFLPLEHRMKMW